MRPAVWIIPGIVFLAWFWWNAASWALKVVMPCLEC